jgi:REP element-mobilizing transposase RayT
MPEGRDHKGWHSRGYLPHFDSPECLQHLVFRTAGSLPRHIANEISGTAEQRRKIYDELLDQSPLDHVLISKNAADIMVETLLYHHEKKYRLVAWCVMPNHVHVLIETQQGFRLGDIVREWKTFSALHINLSLERKGSLWATDYFDRMIRTEEQYDQTLFYIEHNPVAAKLVSTPELWPWSSASMGTLKSER